MNAALVPLARIRIMSNVDLIMQVKQFDSLTILETELLKRLEACVLEDLAKQARTARFFARADSQVAPEVRKIVDWAKERVQA